jgi:phage gp36-like protein
VANYATQADLEDYFGSAEVLIASDRDGDGTADVGVLNSALTAATEEIDSYLAVRYDLPLAAVPGVLIRVCCDVAMYRMSVNSPAMTEDKETRYKDSVKWLEKLTKGTVSLGPEEAQVEVQDEATVSSDSETRVFTRTKMAGIL